MPIHRGPLRSWSLGGGRDKGKLQVSVYKLVHAKSHSRGVWHARNVFEERFVMRQSLGTARATDLQRAGASTRFSRQPGPTAHSGDTTVVVTYPSSEHLILPPCHSWAQRIRPYVPARPSSTTCISTRWRRKPSHCESSASLKLAISLVIHRQNIGNQSCLQIFAVFRSRNFVNNISRTIQQVRSGALDSRGGILSI